MRSFVQLFRTNKGVWVDPDATEGAVIGETLFLRLDDGSLALFQPTAGTIVANDGSSAQMLLTAPSAAHRTVATRSVSIPAGNIGASRSAVARTVSRLGQAQVGGSNSGYAPGSSPATPQSNYDLDPSMIAGLPAALTFSLAPVGNVPNLNAASLSPGNVLNLQPAAASFPGVVSAVAPGAGVQIFTGDKRATGMLIADRALQADIAWQDTWGATYGAGAYLAWHRLGLREMQFINARTSADAGGWYWTDYNVTSNSYLTVATMTRLGEFSCQTLAAASFVQGFVDYGTVGAAVTLNFGAPLAGSGGAKLTLTSATPCTPTFTAPTHDGAQIQILVAQPAAGTPTTINWPGSINAAQFGGVVPQPTPTLGASTLYALEYYAGVYYLLDATVTVAAGGGGVTTMAPIGAAPNANAASIVGTTMTLQPASAAFGGVVTTGAQTFAGPKTFDSVLVNGILQCATTTSNIAGVFRFGNNVFMHQFGAVTNSFGGVQAGNFTLTGGANSCWGYQAGTALTTGGSNTLVGRQAGGALQDGGNNVAYGFQALFAGVSVADCVALGTLALQQCTGNTNIGIGRSAGNNITTGIQNIALGYNGQLPAPAANGQLNIQNIIWGFGNTGTGLVDSTGRIAIGKHTDDGVNRLQLAGSGITDAYWEIPATSSNVAGVIRQNGVPILHTFSANNSNVCVGVNCGNFTMTTVESTMMGYGAGINLTSATGVTLFGRQAGNKVTSGDRTTAVGQLAALNVTTGTDNVAIGQQCLYQVTTGGFNTAIGAGAGNNLTGAASNNIAIGYLAQLVSATANGQWNIGNFIYGVGHTASGLTVSSGRISIGSQADDGTYKLQIYGTTAFYNVNPLISGANTYLDFGATTRQMISLWGSNTYGIGVQSNTQYRRSGGGYAWFKGGVHSDTQNDPGAGGTKLMDLSATGALTVLGNITAANFPGASSGVTTMANIGSAPNLQGASISGVTLTLQPASVSFGGVLTSGAQSIAGNKTFSGFVSSPSHLWPYFDNGIFTGGGITINWNTATSQAMAPNGAANVTIGFISPAASCLCVLNIYGGVATGLSWPLAVHGLPPTSVAAGKNCCCLFFYDGGSVFYYIGGVNNVLLTKEEQQEIMARSAVAARKKSAKKAAATRALKRLAAANIATTTPAGRASSRGSTRRGRVLAARGRR